MQNTLLAIHIIGVALWLGSNLSMGIGSSRAEGQSNEVNAWWADTQGFLGRTLKNAALILVLVTGLGMVLGDYGYEFKNPFVSIGFLVVIIGGAFGGAVFAPGCRKIAESFRNGDTEAAKAEIHKLGAVGALDSFLVVVTIFFMIFKWGN
jgi:hypothetical protein